VGDSDGLRRLKNLRGSNFLPLVPTAQILFKHVENHFVLIVKGVDAYHHQTFNICLLTKNYPPKELFFFRTPWKD